MSREIEVVKKKDRPKRITDKQDLEIARLAKAILKNIYRKHGLDYKAEIAKNLKTSVIES